MANSVPYDQQHRLTERNLDTLTAVCHVCGPVKIGNGRRKSRLQCENKIREEQEYDVSYSKKYNESAAVRARNLELYHQRHWKRAIEKRYGLPEGWYDETLAEQGGVCAVCQQDNPNKFGKYCVDHRHVTGKPRALLCGFCNSLLGFAHEDPDVLERAAAYLRKHNVED